MTTTLAYKPFGILRFVLALCVLTQHFCKDIAPEYLKQAIYPWAPGNIAVLAFFIISGFIICEAYHYNYRNRPSAFIKNRLLRIIPGYWAALIVSILVHFIILGYYGHLLSLDRHSIEAVHFQAHNLIKNFLAVFPPVRVNVTAIEYPFIPYAWALQTEMMFYLTVFFVGVGYQFIKQYCAVPQYYWLALAAFAAIGSAVLTQIGVLPKQLAYGSYFAFGGSLFFYLSGSRRALWVLLPAFIQMVHHLQTYSAGDFTEIAANRPGQFLLMAVFLVVLVTLATNRVRHTSIDRRFGELSYPLYLNHYAIAVIILNTVNDFSISYLVCGLIASLLLSQTVFAFVEKPLVKVRQLIRHQSIANIKEI